MLAGALRDEGHRAPWGPGPGQIRLGASCATVARECVNLELWSLHLR